MNSQLASTCSLVLSNYITITYISVQIQQIMKTMIRPMVGLYSSCTSSFVRRSSRPIHCTVTTVSTLNINAMTTATRK